MRKDERIEQRNRQRNNIGKIDLLGEIEKKSLSLRKQKIDFMLMSKRTLNHVSLASYQIDLNLLDINEDIRNYAKELIKAKIEVKIIWPWLFDNNDIHKQKLGIYLLKKIIITELNEEKEKPLFLSRNDHAVINLLCSLLNHSDIQIKFDSSNCLLNLTSFSPNIEQLIYTEQNLGYIYQCLITSDFAQLTIMIDLVRNCCVKNLKNQLYFYHQGILKAFLIVLKDDRTSEDIKLKIMKCVAIISQSAKKSQYNNDPIPVSSFIEVIVELKPLLIIKDALTNHYTFMFILLSSLTAYSTELFPYLIEPAFIADFINCYYTIESKYKIQILQIITNFLAGSDSQTQILIENGVIDLLKQAIAQYKFESKELLNDILFGVSNLLGGNISQCEEAQNSGILIDMMEIGKRAFNEMKNQSLYKENYNLFGEFLYAICNGLNGGLNEMKIDLCTYDNGILLLMIVYGLGEYSKNTDTIFLLLSTVRSFLLLEENEMIDFAVKSTFQKADIEGKLNALLTTEVNKRNIELIEVCISIIQDV